MEPCLPHFSHIKRYPDPVNKCVTAKILPGEYYVTRSREMLTTVLGSRVSACIYDPVSRVGGMNHFMLPGDANRALDKGLASYDKYGLYAMENMINDILKLGCQRANLRAKVFGGGQILENMSDVGRQNIQFAKEYLKSEAIPIESSDVGLIYPRKINFFPLTGKSFVKRMRTLHNSEVAVREKAYLNAINNKDHTGDIELF